MNLILIHISWNLYIIKRLFSEPKCENQINPTTYCETPSILRTLKTVKNNIFLKENAIKLISNNVFPSDKIRQYIELPSKLNDCKVR